MTISTLKLSTLGVLLAISLGFPMVAHADKLITIAVQITPGKPLIPGPDQNYTVVAVGSGFNDTLTVTATQTGVLAAAGFAVCKDIRADAKFNNDNVTLDEKLSGEVGKGGDVHHYNCPSPHPAGSVLPSASGGNDLGAAVR